MFPKAGPPVLAAGGMVHGGHLASILALGASGVVFGTRFALSPESTYSDVERKALIEAKTSSTVRTVAFDEARNTLGWPRGINGRGLRNGKCLFLPEVLQSEYVLEGLVDDFEQGVDINTLRGNFSQSKQRGDPNGMVIWAGTGVGLLNMSQPAKVSIIHVNWRIEVHFVCRTLWKRYIRNVLASSAKRPLVYSERGFIPCQLHRYFTT